jgi:predicted Ser/Thr protein kinase
MQNVLSKYDWDDIRRMYEDFEPAQWEEPPSGTETEKLKEKTVENLVDEFDYSPASAELTSRRVVEKAVRRWD